MLFGQIVLNYVIKFSRSVETWKKLLITNVWTFGHNCFFFIVIAFNLFLTLTLTVLDVSAVDGCLGHTVQIVPRPRSQPCAGHFCRSQNCFNY